MVISTAHMPGPDPHLGDGLGARFDYGYVVWVRTYDEESICEEPPWIAPILAEARANNCELICFDCDARKYPNLKTYDW